MAATIKVVKKSLPSAVKKSKPARPAKKENVASRNLFGPGSVVIVTLSNPREKFWGLILTLAAQGLSLSGIELASLEDSAAMLKEGQPFTPTVVFFPMHRIERIELDLPAGNLPSLAERFYTTTGLQAADSLTPPEGGPA